MDTDEEENFSDEDGRLGKCVLMDTDEEENFGDEESRLGKCIIIYDT